MERKKIIKITKLYFIEEQDQNKFEENYEDIYNTIRKDKNYESGTLELIWDLSIDGNCESYARHRILYLAYKLQLLGIRTEIKDIYYED